MRIRAFGAWVARVISSRWFFIGVIALFGLEAAWFAFSFRYPGLFDEYYHYGIIRIYSHQWSPFIAHQSSAWDQYGDISHYPSFLFHYLMSFPLRLVALFSGSVTVQVIFLRLVNIVLVGYGVYLFKCVIRRMGVSPLLAHLAMLFFILLPIVPFIAAQINYDNMMFPLIALSMLVCQEIIWRRNVSYLLLLAFAMVSMVAAMVKYTFLPIFLAEVLVVGVILARRHGLKEVWRAFLVSFSATPHKRRLAAAIVTVLIGGVFAGRYGYNVIRYGTPAPECNQVLSFERCAKYGPWARNYRFARALKASGVSVPHDPMMFTRNWQQQLETDLFRVAANTSGPSGLAFSPVFRAVKLAAELSLTLGVVWVIYYWRAIRRNESTALVLVITVTYIASLWLQNFADLLHTGNYVGVQGRYLLAVMPLAIGLVLLGYQQYFARARRAWQGLALGTGLLILFLCGGGISGALVSSDAYWYWSKTPLAGPNQSLGKALHPIIHP